MYVYALLWYECNMNKYKVYELYTNPENDIIINIKLFYWTLIEKFAIFKYH